MERDPERRSMREAWYVAGNCRQWTSDGVEVGWVSRAGSGLDIWNDRVTSVRTMASKTIHRFYLDLA